MSRSVLERVLRLWVSPGQCRLPLRKAPPFRPSLEALETRATPSVSRPKPFAHDDFADTDGSNPVTVALLANDGPSGLKTGSPALAAKAATIKITDGPHHGTIS